MSPFALYHANGLTPAVSGRRPTVAVRFKQIRKRAAVPCTAFVRPCQMGVSRQHSSRCSLCFGFVPHRPRCCP